MNKSTRVHFESVVSKCRELYDFKINVEPGTDHKIALPLGERARSGYIHVSKGASLSILTGRSARDQYSAMTLLIQLEEHAWFEYIQAFTLPEGHAHAEHIDVQFLGRCASANITSHCAQSARSLWIQKTCAHIAQDGAQGQFKHVGKSLRLEDSAHAIIEPQLRISIDEVSASHGAAHGGPSPEFLHAMQSRGFNQEQALMFEQSAFLSQALSGSHWAETSIDAIDGVKENQKEWF